MFLRSILPIGLLFSASLILSNTAYLYLSVAYIQMLKAFTPVAILLISWTFRIQEPSKKLGVIVLMISSGVALASRGELRFNLVGFLTQAAAVAVSTINTINWSLLKYWAVRGLPSCDDPDSLTRPQDGPSCVAPLLCSRLRAHQPCHPPFH